MRSVPNAIEGRDSLEYDIFGMTNVPELEDDEPAAKRARTDDGHGGIGLPGRPMQGYPQQGYPQYPQYPQYPMYVWRPLSLARGAEPHSRDLTARAREQAIRHAVSRLSTDGNVSRHAVSWNARARHGVSRLSTGHGHAGWYAVSWNAAAAAATTTAAAASRCHHHDASSWHAREYDTRSEHACS